MRRSQMHVSPLAHYKTVGSKTHLRQQEGREPRAKTRIEFLPLSKPKKEKHEKKNEQAKRYVLERCVCVQMRRAFYFVQPIS
jgi:hypothetical protein